MTGRLRVAALLATLVLLPACGYSTAPLVRSDAKSLYLDIFDNTTARRGHEFDLTNAVARMIHARTPIRLTRNRNDADLVLAGRILHYDTPGLVEDGRDRLIESRVDISLEATLTDRGGKVLDQGVATRGAAFSSRRGETEDSARAEAIEYLARWVVTLLEERW